MEKVSARLVSSSSERDSGRGDYHRPAVDRACLRRLLPFELVVFVVELYKALGLERAVPCGRVLVALCGVDSLVEVDEVAESIAGYSAALK